ncbi:MAG: group III truncated hemoglobin [Hyphomonas sp.]|nr:group III truncated hemoglobin [Hyphomonas sp.]MCB9970449.1 group III truncated hemoglobin [Hyphomonas sp.]
MSDVIRRTGEERQASIEETAAALEIDEALISDLVDDFYTRIRADALLGPVFEQVVGDHWDTHLPKMKNFWSAVALGTKRYDGRPMPAHMRLPGLTEAHFTRWLTLFRETLDELAPNPAAHGFFLDRACRMANSFRFMIFHANADVS